VAAVAYTVRFGAVEDTVLAFAYRPSHGPVEINLYLAIQGLQKFISRMAIFRSSGILLKYNQRHRNTGKSETSRGYHISNTIGQV